MISGTRKMNPLETLVAVVWIVVGSRGRAQGQTDKAPQELVAAVDVRVR